MISRSFYFLRHGETDWNVAKRLQGHTDIALNENGRTQAQRIIPILQQYKIDRIVASPLARAYETADIVNRVLQKPLEKEERIKEKFFGEFEGKTRDDIDTWRVDNSHLLGEIEKETGYPALPGGERYADVFTRTVEGFTHWLDRYPGEHILFVSHGGVYRVLYRHFFKESSESPNAQPYHFIKENDNLWGIKALS